MLAEIWYLCDSLGFWAKNAEKYLADERVKHPFAAADGQEGQGPLPARTGWSA